MSNSNKIGYGIDAPGVIWNLIIAALIALLLPLVFPVVAIGQVRILSIGFLPFGITCACFAVLMLVYGLYGKFRHRDRMLDMVAWKGDEKVLDVGTGKGLLMIGAAKKLTSGKAVGIDIWNKADLSGNLPENTLNNAVLEGVSDKTEIKNGDVQKLEFADNSFDVVLSNLCLHNIYNKPGRKLACEEIYRVLKKGGVAIISDFKHISEYKKNFESLGGKVVKTGTPLFSTFPPLSIIKVEKA